MSLFAFKRHAGLRAMGRGRPVGLQSCYAALAHHGCWSALRLIAEQPLAATAARPSSGEPAWRMNANKNNSATAARPSSGEPAWRVNANKTTPRLRGG